MNKKIKIFWYIRLAIYAAAIIAAVMLINGIIKTHCYWNENFHILCPTCGMTRATINILRCNFLEAIKLHAVYTCLLFPLALLLAFNDTYVVVKRTITNGQKLSIIEKICGINKSENRGYIITIFVFVIIFLTYGILRNII